jgi:hypothetical protein
MSVSSETYRFPEASNAGYSGFESVAVIVMAGVLELVNGGLNSETLLVVLHTQRLPPPSNPIPQAPAAGIVIAGALELVNGAL